MQVSPQTGRHGYHNILALMNFGDSAVRRDAERQFRKTLAEHGVEAELSSEFFLPGRHYSPDEVKKMFEASKIEAVLVVSAVDAGSNPSWIPELTVREVRQVGGTATAAPFALGSGGTYIDKPWGEFDASLLDVASGAAIWKARLSSAKKAFADWNDLAKSIARKTALQLCRDRVFD